MTTVRVVARLDIKNNTVIKGIRMEGLRVVGNPSEFVQKYYQDGVDEILYIDAVASLYGRNSLTEILRETARHVFVPLTVGGGIRSLEDIEMMLKAGADKVAINTEAVANPEFIRKAAHNFGSQCIVASIQAKSMGEGAYEAYCEYGRERVNLDLFEWVQRVVELGAGEILLTSVDRDGIQKGFDHELIQRVTQLVGVPVVASGGGGSYEHVVDVVREGKADAVALGSFLHYDKGTIQELKRILEHNDIEVRPV